MKLRFLTRTAALAVMFAAAAACLPRAASAQSTKVAIDRRLPPDVYAYVTVPSVPELKKRFKASSYGALLRDKAFEPFLKDVEVAIKQGSAEIEKQLGLKLDDLLEIPSGEVAIAVAKSGRVVPAIAVFVNFGKHEATVDKLLELGSKEATKHGLKRTEVPVKDTKIVVYAKPGEDADAKKKLDFAYFIKDSYFVFATNVDFLKGVVARWDGKHESTFAGNEVYKYIKERTRTGREPVITWYIDPLALAKAALIDNPDGPAPAKLAFGFLPALGINKFRALGGSGDMVVGEYETISKTVLYVDLPATGALNLFNFPAVSLTPPKWVPEKAAAYTAMNWDLAKAYGAVAKLYGIFSFGGPDALGKKIDDWATDPNGPKIHLKKDVLDNLTGQVHVMYEFADPNDATSMRLLVAAGVKNEKKTNALLEKISKLPSFPGKSRKVGGLTVYELDFGIPALPGGGSLVVGVVKNQLMFCTNLKLLEQAAKADDKSKSLADSPAFKRIAAKFPKKTSVIAFDRGSTQLKTIYEQVRSGALGKAASIDFTKLPPFSAVEKYLHASGSYAVPDKRGVYMESFSLRKKND
jgi:hypothetical protein